MMIKMFIGTIRGSWIIKGIRIDGYRLNILIEDLRLLAVCDFLPKELCSKYIFKSILKNIDSVLPGYHYFNEGNNYIELKVPRNCNSLDILRIVKDSPMLNSKSIRRIEEKLKEKETN